MSERAGSNEYVLANATELDSGAPPPPELAPWEGELRRIARWARDYLCNPHEELGREGPVCPYVQTALRRRSFYLTVVGDASPDPDAVAARMLALRDRFLEIEPTSGAHAIFKTILCLFPAIPRSEVPRSIDGVQERLRHDFVERGLMIGEFHDGPPKKAGLWNEHFLPLESPVPMLVIRHMVPTDFPFLKMDRELVKLYLERFHREVPAHLRRTVGEVAEGFGIPLEGRDLLPHVHPRVRRALGEHRDGVRVIRHADLEQTIESPADFARALDWPLGRVTKSLFVRDAEEPAYAILVCSVDRKIDLDEVARQLGWSRLELASRRELSAHLGYAPGGVSPLGAPEGLRVILDEDLLAFPTISVAAGEVAVEIEIGPSLLVRLTDAEVRGITRRAPERIPG